MVESFIQRQPVLTIRDEAFAETQEGTPHFQELRAAAGAALGVGRLLDEHVAQLRAALDDPDAAAAGAEAFLRASCGRRGSTARRRRSSPTRSRRPRERRLPFRLRRYGRRAAMNILLVIKNTANLRTLAPVVRLLAERGHEVRIACRDVKSPESQRADGRARRRQPANHRRRAPVHPPVRLERPGRAAPADDRLSALPRAGLPRLAEAARPGRVGGSSRRSTAGERGQARFRAPRRRRGASCRGWSGASTRRRGRWRSCATSGPTCC